MAGLQVEFCLAVLLLVISTGVDGGTYCLQNYYTSSTYCAHDCCGSAGSQYCCEWSPTVALIVGCVLAGIVVISLIIAAVCCCIKQKAHSGQVIKPAGTVHTTPGTTTVAMGGPVTVYDNSGGYYPPPQPPMYQPPAGAGQGYEMSGFQQPSGYAYGQGGGYSNPQMMGGQPAPGYNKEYM